MRLTEAEHIDFLFVKSRLWTLSGRFVYLTTHQQPQNSSISTPMFQTRLPDARFRRSHDQVVKANLFAISEDGRRFAYEMHFAGQSYRSDFCFGAHELSQLVQTAESQLRDLVTGAQVASRYQLVTAV